MARRRSQIGWIERLGKSWVGYAYKYERLDDGTEKRRVKQHVIGRCAEMDKATAMAEHQKWVAALLSPETAVVPPAPHTFQQAWEKYAALKENSGAW